MRYKAFRLYSILVFMGLMLLVFSCKKETVKVSPWLSSKFEGIFAGNNVCYRAGVQPNSITITASAPTQISIANLYGSGKAFTGTISNDTCIIPPQLYDAGNGRSIMQGSFVLRSDSVMLGIIVTTFGQEDICNAVLLKQ